MDRAAAIALLEEQHSFPSDHSFHVIVRAEPVEVDAVIASLGAFCGLTDLSDRVVRVPSKQGTYLSLRMSLPCASAEAVLDIYAHLGTLAQVLRYL